MFLPPYTPELQPAERLWPLANEAVANHSFHDLATLAKPSPGVASPSATTPTSSKAQPSGTGGPKP